jgi:DNA polymerase-3 subunit delta'
MFGGFLIQALEQHIRSRAKAQGTTELRRWIAAWEQVRANFEQANALHVEPRQTIVSSVHAISNAATHRTI